MSNIIAFPLHRRHGFVKRHAERIAALGAEARRRYLTHQLDIQRAALERRGVELASIAHEISALECAILLESWRRLRAPGGAA